MKKRLRVRWEQSALKAWADRKLYLSREKKLAVSLTVVLVAGLWLWGLAGYPLPTAEMEFRRLERTWLCSPSELVFLAPQEVNHLGGGDAPAFTLFDRWAVGVLDGRARVGYLGGRWSRLEEFPLGEGPSPVPLTAGHINWIETVREGGQMSTQLYSGGGQIFLQIPGQAISGELEVDVSYREWDYRSTGRGWDLGNGVWMFAVEYPEGPFSSDWFQGCAYHLELFGEDGASIGTWKGKLPAPV